MEFGIFDHLDRNDLALADFYESRLKIIEAYDRLGFHSYHVAEHHATPLGMAPSPSVFLAAVAQRTKRLRFGPMVYALPLYHPLRMIEEICMLDQMSRGRLDIGFGRGSSPTELAFFGEKGDEAQAIYTEALDAIIKGLTQPTLDFHGKYFDIDSFPLTLEPFQKPYPPIWYGVHAPDSAERAARRGLQVIELDQIAPTRECYDRFSAVWREAQKDKPLPLMGLGRFVVVAETDDQARSIARRAYTRWHDSFTYLHRRHNYIGVHPRPPNFEAIEEDSRGFAGSPETVLKIARSQMEATGSNYFVGQFVFGDMSLDESLRSIELFARHVMPALRGK
ncbi:MAG TPA: LLM class flavin-dependent oxidoreductase [Stellaceae bacterium]|nr:LLM class flavin-dependent oxidoreductase [Stellaceae bacterium]